MHTLRMAALLGAQAGVLIFFPGLVLGQTSPGSSAAAAARSGMAYTATLRFDVATIKEARTGDTSWIINPRQSGRFEGANLTAEGLIMTAYHVSFATLHGGPSWIHTTRFDVVAKSEHSVDEALAKLSDQDAGLEKQHMLQDLLTKRFNLRAHKQTTIGTTYELVRGKSVSNLRQTVDPAPPPPDHIGICGEQKYSRRGRSLVAEHCSMRALANLLSMAIGSPVMDKTDLGEIYAFTLQWNGKTDAKSESTAGESNLDSWDPLIPAIRDQLGLVLKPTKGPIDSLVIDHIEKPTPNE